MGAGMKAGIFWPSLGKDFWILTPGLKEGRGEERLLLVLTAGQEWLRLPLLPSAG